MVFWHVKHREDCSAPHEGALLLISDVNSLEAIDVRHRVLGVEVVPLFVRREVDLDWRCATEMGHVRSWLANLWCYKDVRSKHELVIEVKRVNILWEFVPHRADDWCSVGGGLEEQVVEVVNLLISLMNCFPDHMLHARALKPWFPHQIVLASVCAEEWIEDAKLIELDEKVIVWNAVEAWDVGSTKDDSRDSEGHKRVYRQGNIIVSGAVITSPHSSIALGAKEEGPAQDERSLLPSVSLVKSLPCRSLLECTIGVVDPPVLNEGSVLRNMSVIHWHATLLDLLKTLALEH